jgi:hypothetical protein
MKKLLIFLFLCPLLAFADPRIDNMVRNCDAVMARGVCKVVLDRKAYPNSTVLVAGVGRIKTDSYLKIRNAGDQMCKVVREVCTADFDSDDCKAARALWRQR